MKRAMKGNLYALSAVILFSTYAIFNKLLLEYFPPMTLATIGQIGSLIALLILFGAIPEFEKIEKQKWSVLLAILVVALLSMVIGPLLILTGLEKTTATNVVLISKLSTVFSGMIAALWLKEKISSNQIYGILVMFFGIAILATEGFKTGFMPGEGDLFIAGSAFAWALNDNIFKKYLHKVSPEMILISINLIASIILLFVVPSILGITHDFTALGDPRALKILASYITFVVIIAQFLWYEALDNTKGGRASTMMLLTPILAVIMAVIFLEESLDPTHFFSGLFIIGGLILTVLHHQKHKHHRKHQHIKHHWMHH